MNKMDVMDFLNKYLFQAKGYNYFNTFIYGLILIGGIYGLYYLLKKFKVKINWELVKGTFPFFILWSVVRVLVDQGTYPENFFTVTPGLFFVNMGIVLAVLGLSKLLEKKFKIKFWKTMFATGIMFLIPNFIQLKPRNFIGFLTIFFMISLILAALYLIVKKTKIKFLNNNLAFLALFSHLIDATATFIAVDFYGMGEKHPLVAFFANVFKTASILYVLKLAVILPFIYLISRYEKEEDFKNALFIALITIGLQAGLRDALLVLVS